MKLDLGAGPISPEGYRPLGRRHGSEIFPLADIADNSCDVIRASHVLEHFPAADVPKVLAEWARALKTGGVLRIAVPDFRRIAENYVSNIEQFTQGYVMGGQIDADDFHRSIFDAETLTKLLRGAGLDEIRHWTSELHDDCAALPVSLNLEGVKRVEQKRVKVMAAMSCPRVGFLDTMFIAGQLAGMGIDLRKHSGAFWEQSLSRLMYDAVDEGFDFIVAVDFDSVFKPADAGYLINLAVSDPNVAAVFPLQYRRESAELLLGLERNSEGKADASVLDEHLVPALIGHFGLTVIRCAVLKQLPHPWLQSKPDPTTGRWGDPKACDADVAFWYLLRDRGFQAYVAPRCVLGHFEHMISWPGQNYEKTFQHASEYFGDGDMPKAVHDAIKKRIAA